MAEILRLFRTAQMAGHHHKFIAADARHNVALACLALQPPGHGHQQGIAHIVAVLVIDGFEPVQIHHIDGEHFLCAAARQGRGQRDVQAAPVGQSRQGVGVCQGAHYVAFAVRIQGSEAQGLGAQTEHPHEKKHVHRGTEFERMQGPEIDRQPAANDPDHRGGRQKINQPCQQQAHADGVATAGPVNSPWNAHERRYQPQNADDGGHGGRAEQVQCIRHGQHHAQHGARTHGSQQAALGCVPRQRLADEQERAAGGRQRGQARRVYFCPGCVTPEVLRAQAKKMQ